MCSISTNSIADNQLDELGRSDDKDMIEARLYNFAKESTVEKPSMLDSTKCHIRRMPRDLRNIRKITIGRHRVYFTGHHTQCSYTAFYIKMFKRSGENDEDNQRFQRILGFAICEPPIRTIEIEE